MKRKVNENYSSYIDRETQVREISSTKLFEILIDRKRLSKALNMGPSTISKLMAEEGLPYYKIGKSCRYNVSEVMAFLEKRKRP